MKSFLTILSCLFITTVFAQDNLQLKLGDQIYMTSRAMRGISPSADNVAKLPHGELKGNFNSGKKTFISIVKDKMRYHGMEEEFCYTTNPVDVSNISEVALSMDITGKGTLDKKDGPNGEVWTDWIDIAYILDGKRTQLGDQTHTIQGIPANFAANSIQTNNAQNFQIEICMRNTGYDEWFYLNNINVQTKKADPNTTAALTDNGQNNVNAGDLTFDISNVNATAELIVFPNPTTSILEIKNSEMYDLNNIIIFDAQGKMVRKGIAHPINVSNFDAGTYFLSTTEKGTNKVITTSFVVMSH